MTIYGTMAINKFTSICGSVFDEREASAADAVADAAANAAANAVADAAWSSNLVMSHTLKYTNFHVRIYTMLSSSSYTLHARVWRHYALTHASACTPAC